MLNSAPFPQTLETEHSISLHGALYVAHAFENARANGKSLKVRAGVTASNVGVSLSHLSISSVKCISDEFLQCVQ